MTLAHMLFIIIGICMMLNLIKKIFDIYRDRILIQKNIYAITKGYLVDSKEVRNSNGEESNISNHSIYEFTANDKKYRIVSSGVNNYNEEKKASTIDIIYEINNPYNCHTKIKLISLIMKIVLYWLFIMLSFFLFQKITNVK